MSIPRPLTGNALKLLAAAFMVADHVGLLFFPGEPAFRLAGRLAYPIFAFMIAEGCHYTRSKGRYFLSVFLLGAVCQLVYFLVDGSWYLSILITFSLAILLIYAFQAFQRRPVCRQPGGGVGHQPVFHRGLRLLRLPGPPLCRSAPEYPLRQADPSGPVPGAGPGSAFLGPGRKPGLLPSCPSAAAGLRRETGQAQYEVLLLYLLPPPPGGPPGAGLADSIKKPPHRAADKKEMTLGCCIFSAIHSFTQPRVISVLSYYLTSIG